LHLAEDALALHLLLQCLESLIDVVVADLNQQAEYLGVFEPVAYAVTTAAWPAQSPARSRTPRVGATSSKLRLICPLAPGPPPRPKSIANQGGVSNSGRRRCATSRLDPPGDR